jgi:hypothetical protein
MEGAFLGKIAMRSLACSPTVAPTSGALPTPLKQHAGLSTEAVVGPLASRSYLACRASSSTSCPACLEDGVPSQELAGDGPALDLRCPVGDAQRAGDAESFLQRHVAG